MSTPAAQHPPEAAADYEDYISVKEAARFLSIPVNTCYKLCLSRTLPSYKAGKLRRLKKSEVAAFMESNRVEALPGR
ncbi:MAG: helix-turn-helix domain-containing protein, partial [Geobacteraceae bacterium]|nr:helix-turn-helix domain-containing protein [Geobacteraceae bacterium]